MPGTPRPNTDPNWQRKAISDKKSSVASQKGGIFGGIANSGGGPLSSQLDSGSNDLAVLIERQAAAAKAKSQAAQGPAANPYDMLQQQLFNAVNGVQAQTTPLDQLRKMATSQVSAQFDPQIQGLLDTMKGSQARGARSEKEARQMYGDLSKDFLSQLPDLTAQYAADDKATNARYDQAQQQMQGEYDKQAAEQDAVLKRLGVQAAQPDSSQQARDDQAYFQNQSNLDQQQQLNSMDQQQNASLDYQRGLGNSAKMAGENTAQDIAQQLSDYLTQSNGQLNTLRGQKQSGIAALLSQMQQQDAQSAESTRQKEIDNLMAMFNFQLSAQKAGDSAASKGGIMGGIAGAPAQGGNGSLFKGTSGLSGASNYLAEQYPNQPILATNLQQELNNVLSNPDVVKGKYVLDPGNASLGKGPTYSNVGQEYMMDLLRQNMQQQGGKYNSGDINNAMNELLAYLGKLR